jgi:hypothetical protein
MPNKSFSIYNSEEDSVVDADDCLVLEIGRNHVACIKKKVHKKIISDFELFSFTENEAGSLQKLFKSISFESKLLTKEYPATDVFINNELSVLVPVFNFNTTIARDYLNIVFGEDESYKIQFDHLPVEPGMMNAYRVPEDLLSTLHQTLTNTRLKHTYSNIVKTVVSNISSFPSECIYIQFYNTFIIVVVIKEEKLCIIQSFVYETPEDVLYNLLNITERFELDNNGLTVQISGMIDLNYTLYRDLITYFRHVEVQNVVSSSLHLDVKDYPLHYFTPFFNLAL